MNLNVLSFFRSNFGWFYYGMLKLDHTIILVNVIGAVLQCLYIITFTFFTKQKVSVELQNVSLGHTVKPIHTCLVFD